ncbi:hypothetical protein KQI65_16055 [bacterium]|nr:hypothetical protein [bacterium]
MKRIPLPVSATVVVSLFILALALTSCTCDEQPASDKNALILELVDHVPTVVWSTDPVMRIGDTRRFTIGVQALSRGDEVSAMPTVKVFRDGEELQTITVMEDAGGPQDAAVTGTAGERSQFYNFTWTAQESGTYEFWIQAGTNHLKPVKTAEGDIAVKVGSLTFSREELQAALDSDPVYRDIPLDALFERSANLNPVKFIVTVVEE